MIFEILGTKMGPIVLSDEERQKALPDIDSLLEMYFNKHFAESPMEHAKNKLVNKVKHDDEKKYKAPINFNIQSITANHKKNAFTVVWGDGSHTIIHLQPGDVWDDEKALAMCFVKHMMGDKNSFNDIFTKDMPAKIKHIGKVEPVEEKCNCDGKRDHGIHPCTKCNCKEESEVDKALAKEFVKKSLETTNAFGVSKKTADGLAQAAARADVALKDMINALTNEPVKIQQYNLFLVSPDGSEKEIYHQGTDGEIHKAMRAYRMKHYPMLEANRTPYRMWQKDGALIVDFGAGSYFKIPGMDHDTFVKGK